MDNIIQFGGRKFQTPSNIEERKILYDIVRTLDPARFREFVSEHIPELVNAGWLDKSNEQITLILHEVRAQYVGMADEFTQSRNFLRARQFKYCPIEIKNKPVCAECKYFRTPPDGEQLACMHLGSIPQDICCPGFTKG